MSHLSGLQLRASHCLSKWYMYSSQGFGNLNTWITVVNILTILLNVNMCALLPRPSVLCFVGFSQKYQLVFVMARHCVSFEVQIIYIYIYIIYMSPVFLKCEFFYVLASTFSSLCSSVHYCTVDKVNTSAARHTSHATSGRGLFRSQTTRDVRTHIV